MKENFDVLVIGAGPGGYVAAIRAAQLGLKVACVDKRKSLGGTCLNVGCIPSKTLLHASELYSQMAHEAKDFGVEAGDLRVNFKRMMEKKEEVVKGFAQGIQGLFKKNKIKSISGEAKLIDPKTVEVTDAKGKEQKIGADAIILATGSEPTPLPFLDFDEERVLSSTGALALKSVPRKMLVVGAGVIGLELGSVYARLGSEVTFVEYLDQVCSSLDADLSKALQKVLTEQGMRFHLGHEVTRGKIAQDHVSLIIADKKEKHTTLLSADVALVSIGRRPVTAGLNLEEVGVKVDGKGFVQIDSNFRTSVPTVYAIGDLVDGPMLAHKASEEGVAVAELIAGFVPHVNYMAVPSVVYTWPEVAAVGMTEAEAKEAGVKVRAAKFPFKANSRARCAGQEEGFVKVLADETSGRIVGMHIIGPSASELISDGMLAIEKKATVQDLASSPYAHPTLSEATKEACLSLAKKAIHM